MNEDKEKADAFLKGLMGLPPLEGEKADQFMSTPEMRAQLMVDIIELMKPDAGQKMSTDPLAGLAQMTLLLAYCVAKRHGVEGLREYILDSKAAALIHKDKL